MTAINRTDHVWWWWEWGWGTVCAKVSVGQRKPTQGWEISPPKLELGVVGDGEVSPPKPIPCIRQKEVMKPQARIR